MHTLLPHSLGGRRLRDHVEALLLPLPERRKALVGSLQPAVGIQDQIKKWGKISYKQLYNILSKYENLIGFWRRGGYGKNYSVGLPPQSLVFFEWGPSFVTGSWVFPSNSGTFRVVKAPFLWLSVLPSGHPVSFFCPYDLFHDSGEFGLLEDELVPVNITLMCETHLVVEENLTFPYWNLLERRKIEHVEDAFVAEIYQFFANRKSAGGDRPTRKHRRKKWETEHFVKIVNCSPTPSRPLQGLWKGFCDDMKLDFYLVVYNTGGGIVCRRVGDSSQPFSTYSPVFWTSTATFIESPFSPEENYLYDSRIHLRPPEATDSIDHEVVSRILHTNSSYDLVIPDLAGASKSTQDVEGRIWLYREGTFGFGFLRNNYIIDLKHIAQNGCILDSVEPFTN
ncbi:hypothetical protein NMG60_11031249 [Bertholletia excelsa]